MNNIFKSNINDYNPNNLTQAQLWMLSLGSPLDEANYERHDILCCGKSIEDNKHILKRDYSIVTKEDFLVTLDGLATGSGMRNHFSEETDLISTLSSASQDNFINTFYEESDNYVEYSLAKTYYYSIAPGRMLAWDYGRYVFLCKIGAFIKLISTEEAWALIKKIALNAQKSYSSWREYGLAYFTGRQYWQNLLTKDYADRQIQILKRLILNENSPWNRIDWNTKLE